MPRRVLLTGHGGFVGSHTLIHLLLNTDWTIIGIDSFRHRGITDRLREILYDSHPELVHRFKSFRHDLTIPFSPVLLEELGDLDYIINMASESHVDRSIVEPVPFVTNNVELMLTMLELARIKRPEKFIQISTDEVYGPALTEHHREWSIHRPSNPYSASKAAQEDICYAYWRSYGLPICITNTMNIIGEMQDPEKFVPLIIKKILTGDTVQIHAQSSEPGARSGSRFYLHARNQADALLHILNNLEVPVYGQGDMARYNVVGERELDNLELAQLVAQIMGRELKYELVDWHTGRPGHDSRYALDGAKLAATGWRPPVSLEDSLIKTVNWTVANDRWLL
jgi:dTDP-glucose 4,6-dehydratase